MGKIRVAKLGDESDEKEQKRRAEARREGKKAKKQKVEGVGLKGGERTSVVEGGDLKPEFRKLVEEVESGETGKKHKEQDKEVRPRVRSKSYLKNAGLVDRTKYYGLQDAVKLVKQTSTVKFDATVEAHVNLNPNAMEGKNELRGTVNLPHGTGKKVNVVIADDDIVAQVEKGIIAFDVLVAHPSMMPKLAKVARVLGPRGLMPNPKNGTVTTDVEKRVTELSQGQVNYKSEPNNPILHMPIGKVSFEQKIIAENVMALIDSVGRGKISKLTISSTMGPGVKVALEA
jgi:large subunit ribosomal protein L1